MGVSNQFPAASYHPGLSEAEWKEAYDELRRKAKVFVFGIGYGMQDQGIAERLHCSEQEGGMLRSIYTGSIFPRIDDYFADCDEQMERGILYDELGREGHFYDAEFIKANARNEWQEMQRTGYNMPIQGGLTDLQQYVHPRLELAFDGRIWITLTVHDSTFGESDANVSDEEQVALMWELKKYHEDMSKNLVKWDGTPLAWEIPVEVSWGESWGHMKNKITAAGTLKLEDAEDDD
jgi:DNA polymerase I-like protein with 3'-5' exonuclease and polymerase domains